MRRHRQIQVALFHLFCAVDVVVDGTAVREGHVFVVEVHVGRGARAASVGELGTFVDHVGHGVSRGPWRFHRGQAVVSFALGFVGIDQDHADVEGFSQFSEAVVTSFPTFCFGPIAHDKRTSVARKHDQQAVVAFQIKQGVRLSVDAHQGRSGHRGFFSDGLFLGKQGGASQRSHASKREEKGLHELRVWDEVKSPSRHLRRRRTCTSL